MYESVLNYLRQVERAAKLQSGCCVLLRDVRGHDPVVITRDNWLHDYLKPDEGFSSAINLYKVKNAGTDDLLTTFGLFQFPNCCALCVSTQAYVSPKFRRLGINKLSNAFRQEIAASEGYAALVCTDILTNEAERRTLVSQGWNDIFQVHNKRTGNDVILSVKRL